MDKKLFGNAMLKFFSGLLLMGLLLFLPAGSFAFFSLRTKLFMSLAMLLGRLELYPILVLFSPRTWKN